MPLGLYLAAEGALVQQQRLEVIANNMANVNTAGFKRDVATFQARFAEAIQQGQDYPGSYSVNNVGGGVKMIETLTDYSPGALRHTSMPTDFAINGEGFFTVRSPQGETFLTKAGNFVIDAQGRLLTQTGDFAVLDDGGAPIQIDGTLPFEVEAGGRIVQDGSAQAIGLVAPQSLGDLVKVGSNMFRSLGPTTQVAAEARDVRQGFLEDSGVNSTREMMAMIETTRAFEANTKLIQHQDGMISGLIGRLLTA
ncbi:MAG: flagellar hook-basal body protein [Pirellulales bacterium]|nr:flagellar hook-basal body protein [Pirellulales bacterium]MBX3432753.1 flagellar hook-basal body protein [Pirellulales bacterium]